MVGLLEITGFHKRMQEWYAKGKVEFSENH